MESTHPEPTKSITCGICSKKLLPQEELDVHVYTHHKKMFKCGKCEYETEQQEELQKHVTEKHQGSGRCKTCPAFHTMEVKFKLLKENYERLITINKNLQDQAKDRGYAQDVLNAELRNNYDSVKAENIKLNDDLETQNKLWKIWLAKLDDKQEATTSDNDMENDVDNVAEKVAENTAENEQASAAESVEEEIIGNEVEDIDSEEIFQRFMSNRSRGFKRTSPATQSLPVNKKNSKGDLNCETCGYQAENKSSLTDHVTRVHKITRRTDNRAHVTKPQVPQTKVQADTGSKDQQRPLYCIMPF